MPSMQLGAGTLVHALTVQLGPDDAGAADDEASMADELGAAEEAEPRLDDAVCMEDGASTAEELCVTALDAVPWLDAATLPELCADNDEETTLDVVPWLDAAALLELRPSADDESPLTADDADVPPEDDELDAVSPVVEAAHPATTRTNNTNGRQGRVRIRGP